MQLPELRAQPPHRQLREQQRRRDAEHAAHLIRSLRRGGERFHDLTHRPFGPAEEQLARFGQLQAVGAPLDEAHAQLLFQLRHPAGQGGLGPAAGPAGAAEAAVGGDEVEVGQGIEVHVFQI